MFQVFSLNMDTYECSKVNFCSTQPKYGHEQLFLQDRILLIGGICSLNDFTPTL